MTRSKTKPARKDARAKTARIRAHKRSWFKSKRPTPITLPSGPIKIYD